jgi:hypothetical protein
MKFKLGDLVVKKNSSSKLLFQITEFDGDSVLIKGIQVPVLTIAETCDLIKINRSRDHIKPILKRVK